MCSIIGVGAAVVPRLRVCCSVRATVGLTRLGRHGRTATHLMQSALEAALGDARITLDAVKGLIAVPSLSEPRFMQAHYLATRVGLLPAGDVLVRTIDTGGAGPVSSLLEARRMVCTESVDVCAVVAGDAVSSMSTEQFLERADQGCRDPDGDLASPVIPHGYGALLSFSYVVFTYFRLDVCD